MDSTARNLIETASLQAWPFGSNEWIKWAGVHGLDHSKSSENEAMSPLINYNFILATSGLVSVLNPFGHAFRSPLTVVWVKNGQHLMFVNTLHQRS